jgi:hypothetical protein
MLYTITPTSGCYPDIAAHYDNSLFENKFFILIGIFYLKASRSCRICFVTAYSQWTTTASWADASHLRQP